MPLNWWSCTIAGLLNNQFKGRLSVTDGWHITTILAILREKIVVFKFVEMATPQVIFLGRSAHVLPAAATRLVDQCLESSPGAARIDLSGLLVVFPVSRAARRFFELLVLAAERLGKPLIPPRVATLGALPELLYEPRRPLARGVVQEFAWLEALRGAAPEILAKAVPHRPQDDNLPAWYALVECFSRLDNELAAAGHTFGSAAQKLEGYPEYIDTTRWYALEALRAAYLVQLESRGVSDRNEERRVAVEEERIASELKVVLVGCLDLPPAFLSLLSGLHGEISSYVAADASERERFDQYGGINASWWSAHPPQVPLDRILLGKDASGQAAKIAELLSVCAESYPVEQVTVGAADERLMPVIRESLAGEGIRCREGVGAKFSGSEPLSFLALLAAFLPERGYEACAALIRHPLISVWRSIAGAPELRDPVLLLDGWFNRHLPRRVSLPIVHEECELSVVALVGHLDALCTPFTGQRRLDQWGEPVMGLFRSLYGDAAVDINSARGRELVEVFAGLRELFDEYRHCGQLPELDGAQALAMIVRHLSSQVVPHEPEDGALELLGWLELPLDDAAITIVAGMNEGCVPESVNSDSFLPNAIRRYLGVLDNDRRCARDAAAVASLCATRSVYFIAGRFGSDGDRLLPSRLLLSGDRSTLAAKIALLYPEHEELSVRVPRAFTPGHPSESRFVLPPEPLECALPESVRVTAFKDYLACPYRFYLRHIVSLEAVDDDAQEMSAAHFGTVMHEVLKRFAAGRAANSCVEEEIRGALDQLIDQVAHEQFGSDLSAAIMMQLYHLKRRLAAFAGWQADWRAQGWKIFRPEYTIPGAEIRRSGGVLKVKGRIDRIDVHERSGEWIIFDYKSGDKEVTPEARHKKRERWIDLQLPLYAELLKRFAPQEFPLSAPRVGFIQLPADLGKCGAKIAEWDQEVFADAWREAERVTDQILERKFWPPSMVSDFDDFAEICGRGQFQESALEESEQALEEVV